jgi:hypothetical protein
VREQGYNSNEISKSEALDRQEKNISKVGMSNKERPKLNNHLA